MFRFLNILIITFCSCVVLFGQDTPIVEDPIFDKKQIADAYIKSGNYKAAKESLLELDTLLVEDYNVTKQLATIFDQEENVPKALKYYLRLTRLDSTKGQFFRKVARQYAKAGESRQAKEYYQTAYELNDKDFMTVKALAEIAFATNDTLALDSLLTNYRSYDRENISINQLMARYYYKQKEYDHVVNLMDTLRRRVDLNSYYCKLFGYALLKVDSLDQGIFYLQRSLVHENDSENIHYYLSEAYLKKDEKETALHHLEQAIEFGISQKIGKYYRSLAKIHDEAGDLKEALPAYEEAYRYTKNPLMLFFLARGYDAYYADKSVAIRYYNRYIKSEKTIPEYKSYAQDRKRFLKEQVHFTKNN